MDYMMNCDFDILVACRSIETTRGSGAQLTLLSLPAVGDELTQSKRPEKREFYLRMAMQEKWTSRERERQYSLATFERAVMSR